MMVYDDDDDRYDDDDDVCDDDNDNENQFTKRRRTVNRRQRPAFAISYLCLPQPELHFILNWIALQMFALNVWCMLMLIYPQHCNLTFWATP